MTLDNYGWNWYRQASGEISQEQRGCARVIAEFGNKYMIATPDVVEAKLSGSTEFKMRPDDMPKVGDFVRFEQSNDEVFIKLVLPRINEISRGVISRNGSIKKQLLVTNVNLALIIQPANRFIDLTNLERFIFQLSVQNIEPIIVLNKVDQAKNLKQSQDKLATLGIRVLSISAINKDCVDAIRQLIGSGQTVAIMGQSGAGKSTLTNCLLGRNVQATNAVKASDASGRHTTVRRELFLLDDGSMIIDMPGVKRLDLWGDEKELDRVFPEIIQAINDCKFRNCQHKNEAGCVIRAGLKDGSIDEKRYRMYLSLKNELNELYQKQRFITDRKSEWSRELAKKRRARLILDDD